MLFCTLFLGVVRHVQLHVLVHGAEAIAERGILNSFLISDDECVEGEQRLRRVYQEVPVPRDRAHRVREESEVDDRGERSETLHITPVRDHIIVQIEELETVYLLKYLFSW